MANDSPVNGIRYPKPESQSGWKTLDEVDEVRQVGGMDPDRLETVNQVQEFLNGGDSWAIVIIRHGYLVREFYTFNVLRNTAFEIWSCTKSFTGIAFGLLFEDSRRNVLPAGAKVDLATPAYDHIPDGHPLSDERKAGITLHHLLSMTTGIPGESAGLIGMPTATGVGPFEHALGRHPNRYGKRADRLAAAPGEIWDYSDAAFCQLSLVFANVCGREMRDVMHERIFSPIGVENLNWDLQGGGGHLGPHTNAHMGIKVSAREFARIGYLLLHRGVWEDTPLIPSWWLEKATRPSQELNPSYGYTFWVNTEKTQWKSLPPDAFALSGYRSNRCYVIPSLDLVVARVGTGPAAWDEEALIGSICGCVR